MAESASEKTEQASERQIERFREEGKVAFSRELVAATGLIVGMMAIGASTAGFVDGIGAVLRFSREHAVDPELDPQDLLQLADVVVRNLGPPLLVPLGASTFATILAGVAGTGFNLAPAALEPKLERLDVFASFSQMYGSITPWITLAKGLAVTAVIGWAAWSSAREHLDAIPPLASATVPAQVHFAVMLVTDFGKRVLPVVLVVGAGDYAWQRYKLSQDMRMDRQELKDEAKETEGDPHIKARRRARQRQIATTRTLAAVQDAQVVVVNPTHYAVALRYRREEHAAPVVVARGVDHLALRIRQEAARHDVPIVENRPLARALYAKAKLGRPIPAELYGPVAQVLAVIFRRRQNVRRAPAVEPRPLS